MSVFDASNQLSINAINLARDDLELYWKAIEMIADYNNMAIGYSVFLTSAQR